jgi:hypothetical protein
MAGESHAPVLSEVAIGRTVVALLREFRGAFTEATVERLVRETLERWPAPRVRVYIELFAYRFTKARMLALRRAEVAA